MKNLIRLFAFRLVLLILLTLPFLSFGQSATLGKKIKQPFFTFLFPIVEKESYAVSFQPTKLGDLALLAGVNYVKTISINYANQFSLIQHDYNAEKNNVFKYSIDRRNRFKAYTFDENFFYVLSSNVIDNQPCYYLDIIDLNTFKHEVINKQIIKFTSRQSHNIDLFKKTSNELILIFETRELINNYQEIEIFLLSSENKVSNYFKEKMLCESESLDYAGFHESENHYSVIYKSNTLKYQNDKSPHSRAYVVEINSEGTNVLKVKSPDKHLIMQADIIESLCLVSLASSKKLSYADALTFSNYNDSSSSSIPLPAEFTTRVNTWTNGAIYPNINYKFTLISDEIFLIETYRSYYNSGFTQNSYGPMVVVKSSDHEVLDWSVVLYDKPISVGGYFRNFAFFKTDETLHLFYRDNLNLKLIEVDMETGEKLDKAMSFDDKWKRSNIAGFQFNSETNSAIVLLSKRTMKPLQIKL